MLSIGRSKLLAQPACVSYLAGCRGPSGQTLTRIRKYSFWALTPWIGLLPSDGRELPRNYWSARRNRNLWQNRQNRQRKTILRRLTQRLSFVAAWFTLAVVVAAQSVEPDASGDPLLARALDTLDRHVSLAARLRHQSRLNEYTLMGSGNYWQRGTANQRVSRWEMQTQVAGKTASFVQVYDGNHLWTDRRLPSGREVHRLDVKLLQERLPSDNAVHLQAAAQGRGGLAQMLADLLHRFEFGPPRQTQLNGLAVYALTGRWREEELLSLWPDRDQQAEGTTSWPKQLPHHVLVLLGKDNLFPYVIEHRRWNDAYLLSTVAGLRPTRDPLVRYEVFEVQFASAMDPRLFQYKPGDVPWTDETALVVERLREPRRE